MEKNLTSPAKGQRRRGPKGTDAPETQSGSHAGASAHPFAKWMRPTTNAGKARRNWEEAEDENHWLRLVAEATEATLQDDAPPSARPVHGFVSPADAEESRLLQEQGWALSGPVLSEAQINRLFFLGETVRNAGWPRVFAYLYKETWQILRAPHFQRTLSAWLGEGYLQLPGLWFHHVAAIAGARGWGPHVDSANAPTFDAMGHPDRITIWLPLVDVDVDRSCMFVVPSHESPPGLAQKILLDDDMPIENVLRLMHASQPLPCQAGALVAWRPDVLHWGGIHQGLGGPRSSLSLEFMRSNIPLAPDEELCLASNQIPDFMTRLYLVARGLLAYGKSPEREPFAYTFLSWAESVYRRHQSAAMRATRQRSAPPS